MNYEVFYSKYHMMLPMRFCGSGKLELSNLGEGKWVALAEEGQFTREGVKVLCAYMFKVVLPSENRILVRLNNIETDCQSEEDREFREFNKFQINMFEDFKADLSVIASKFQWTQEELLDGLLTSFMMSRS